MKKVAMLLSAIGFAIAAPLATASEDGLELMPSRIEGVEITHFVRDARCPGAQRRRRVLRARHRRRLAPVTYDRSTEKPGCGRAFSLVRGKGRPTRYQARGGRR